MVKSNNTKKNKVVRVNRKLELLTSKLKTTVYPTKSLLRAFSNVNINYIQNLSEINIINVYDKWREKEAKKRKYLRLITKKNIKKNEFNMWDMDEFCILSEFILFNKMGIS